VVAGEGAGRGRRRLRDGGSGSGGACGCKSVSESYISRLLTRYLEEKKISFSIFLVSLPNI